MVVVVRGRSRLGEVEQTAEIDPTVTLDRYGHLVGDLQDELARGLDAAYRASASAGAPYLPPPGPSEPTDLGRRRGEQSR